MVKRILAGVGGDAQAGGPLAWSAFLARATGASVTTAPVLDLSSWKPPLPTAITANQAARVLENQPWTQASDLHEATRRFCCQTLSGQ
ncbi:MAG: hypothetical protein MUF01_15005, partial [Bryobacterales bacterium]|nr:hypothetical protein [Bryobacterales bacterium]